MGCCWLSLLHCGLTLCVCGGVLLDQDSRDIQPMLDVAKYVNLEGPASDGLHNRVSGYFWWAWNANSGAFLPAHSTPVHSSMCVLACCTETAELCCWLSFQMVQPTEA